jgi:enoyl-CoA hydratase
MTDRVTYENKDGIGWIHMDDGKVNAVNGPLLDQLNTALDQAEGDEVSAVVLAGRLGYFSAGLDLKTLPTLEPAELRRVLLLFGTTTIRLASFPRPIVALSAGHTLAAGAVLLLCADYKIGCEGPFHYGLNEVTISIAMPTMVCELARHVLDPRWYHRSIGHGERYTPEQALQAGYLDELRPPQEVVRAAEEVAARLAALPDPAYRTTKLRLRRPIIEAGKNASLEGEVLAHFEGF